MKTINFGELLREHEPEEYILDWFSFHDKQQEVQIRTCDNPGSFVSYVQEKTIRELSKAGRNRPIVKDYRKDANHGPILVQGKNILDGNHRALAAHLEKRPIEYVDISDIPEPVV